MHDEPVRSAAQSDLSTLSLLMVMLTAHHAFSTNFSCLVIVELLLCSETVLRCDERQQANMHAAFRRRCWSIHALKSLQSDKPRVQCRQGTFDKRREYGKEWVKCFFRQFAPQTVGHLHTHISVRLCSAYRMSQCASIISCLALLDISR